MKPILVVVAWTLLTAGAATAQGIRLVAQPDIAPQAAAFPRLAPNEPQAARINTALDAADARAKVAADECRAQIEYHTTDGLLAGGGRLDTGRVLGWTRAIAVAMRGPRYLALVTTDYADCGGIHPNTDSVALTYDLRTGQPPNWPALLPKRLVQTVTIEQAMDGTPLGMVASPELRSLYLAAAREPAAAVSESCMPALLDLAGPFMLWPDATQRGIVVRPSRLPHAAAACGVPVVIGVDVLRSRGVQPALLDAIGAAHRAVVVPAPSRPPQHGAVP